MNNEPDLTRGKKPYSQPRLQNYGDLRRITNKVGDKMSPDGGMQGEPPKTAL